MTNSGTASPDPRRASLYPPSPEHLMRGLQDHLAKSQWWPAVEWQGLQDRQLARLLDHTFATVPFYGERLSAAGYKPGQALDAETWSRLPLLTRRDLQTAGAALLSRAIPPDHGEITEVRTSGSTGIPVAIKVTTQSAVWFRAITLREQVWHGRDFAGIFAAIRKYRQGIAMPPDGDRQPRWADSASVPYVTGPAAVLNIKTPVAEQADWLQRIDPHYLLTYPSNLAALVDAHQAGGLRLARLREVITMGEILPPETRALVRAAWGVPVRDTYSAKEIGYIALQCPEQEHLHIQPEVARVEVLDAAGRPCGVGEVGRVVVTPLHNFAMPLIRYEIGDYAEVGAPCRCGRSLPVLARVAGRVRNMLIGPSGRRYWPSFGTSRYREIAPVRRHQFVQKAKDRLEARMVVERALTAEEEGKLRMHILSRLPEPFTLTFAFVDDIPASEGGKLENFICEVGGIGKP